MLSLAHALYGAAEACGFRGLTQGPTKGCGEPVISIFSDRTIEFLFIEGGGAGRGCVVDTHIFQLYSVNRDTIVFACWDCGVDFAARWATRAFFHGKCPGGGVEALPDTQHQGQEKLENP